MKRWKIPTMRILESEAAMGLWNLSGSGFHRTLAPREGKDLIKAAYRRGIRLFDTAYSYGDADSILSSALRELGSSDARIIEKVMPVPTIRRKVEASLKRLRRESVSILLLHWPTSQPQLWDSLEEIAKLKAEGKAEAIGVSNFPLDLLKKAAAAFPIEYHERPLSLVWSRDHVQEEELGLKTIAYSPLGMGILSGRHAIEDIKDRRGALPVLSCPTLPALLKELGGDASKALSWVYGRKPCAVVSGFGSIADLEILSGIRKLDEEEDSRLSALSDAISSECASDNIFAHSWK